MTIDEKISKYMALCHAMQSGVKAWMEWDDTNTGETNPKHLRTGINAAMSDHGALVKLLMDKGIITQDEYYDTLIEFMEREVASYEERINQFLGSGKKIKLA